MEAPRGQPTGEASTAIVQSLPPHSLASGAFSRCTSSQWLNTIVCAQLKSCAHALNPTSLQGQPSSTDAGVNTAKIANSIKGSKTLLAELSGEPTRRSCRFGISLTGLHLP